jgi:hypothetical protein
VKKHVEWSEPVCFSVVDIGLSLLIVETISSTKRRKLTEPIRISMVDVGFYLLIVEDTSSPETKVLKELEVANIVLLRFAFGSRVGIGCM